MKVFTPSGLCLCCLALFCNLVSLSLEAQHVQLPIASSWLADPYDQRLFIENKGQFNGKNLLDNSEIRYGVDCKGIGIYFTSKGLTYRFDKIEEDAYRENNKEKEDLAHLSGPEYEQEAHERLRMSSYTLHMEWIGANPDAEIIASDASTAYFNYMDAEGQVEKAIYHAKGFQKLVYKELYPGIDVTYIFHEKKGIKYSFTVKPGADPSVIKMHYIGSDGISIDQTGNMLIGTPNELITDHAPVSWYYDKNNQKKPVTSSFSISNDIISFRIGKYSKKQVLVIDPWTIVPTQLLTDLKAFDIDRDAAGNVYVFGGYNPYKLQKYTSAGALLWTFNTVYGVSSAFGDMAIDPNGYAYIMDGFPATGRTKVDPAGTQVWQNSGGMFEQFNLAFNCNYSKLAIGGRTGLGDIGYLNMNTGAMTSLTAVSNSEVRSMCIAPNNNVYSLTCLTVGSGAGNFLIANTQTLGPVYSINSGYAWQENGVTYSNGVTILGPGWAGQNGIATDQCYIYTTNGSTVQKRDIATGAVLINTIIPGGVNELNSGVAVDNCGYVYVGSQAGVYKFDQNLLAMGAPANTPAAVYSVAIGTGSEILACGNGFVASLDMGSCGKVSCTGANLSLTFLTTDASCGMNNGSATVIPAGGVPPYTYSWNTVPVQNTQTANNLAAGNYIVTVTDATGCLTGVDTIAVASSSGLTANISNVSHITCNGANNGSATANAAGGTGPYTYSWNTVPAQSTQTASNLPPGNYTVVITDNSGCTNTATVTIKEPYALSTIIFAYSNVTCNGANDGTASATVNGGTAPYTYLWNTNPVQTSVTATGLAPGTWTVQVTDSNGCAATTNTAISEPAPLQGSTSKSDVTCPRGADGTAVASASGGTPDYTYEWNTNPVQTGDSITGLTVGSYTVTIRDANNCVDTRTVDIAEPAALVLSLSKTDVTCNGNTNGSATVSASGGTAGYTYQWNTNPVQYGAMANGLGAGTYTVTVADANNCQQSGTVTITEPAVLTTLLSSTDTLIETGNPTTIQAASSGGSGQYTYTWSPSIGTGQGPHTVNPLINTVYYVQIEDQNAPGCMTADSILIIVTEKEDFYFHIPSAFSPNGDGDNDEFKPLASGIADYRLSIFDRWGEKVFTTAKVDEKWNGGKNNAINEGSPEGTYIYIASFSDKEGTVYKKYGTVSLLR